MTFARTKLKPIDSPSELAGRTAGYLARQARIMMRFRIMQLVVEHSCAPPDFARRPVSTEVGRHSRLPSYCCPECGQYFVGIVEKSNLYVVPGALSSPHKKA